MAEKQEKSPFSDPIYKQLSQINGQINRMGKSEAQAKLKELRLDSRGEVDVLKRRLKNFYKQQKLKKKEILEKQDKDARCPYNFLCVIDFEATCEGAKVPDYPHEIIEFPAVLVDTRQKAIVDTFHEYCKPSLNPQLSEFCRSLTGISQETIDGADTFPEVLQKFENWLKDKGLGSDYSFCVATDGPWDMGRFLHLQCQFCQIPFPRWGKKWVNIRKAYTNFYKTKSYSLVPMLELLGLKFEGQQHCGFDDARNISRIAICMLKDGAHLKVNERIDWNRLQMQVIKRWIYPPGDRLLQGPAFVPDLVPVPPEQAEYLQTNKDLNRLFTPPNFAVHSHPPSEELVVQAFARHLHVLGLSFHYYIDNWLLLAHSEFESSSQSAPFSVCLSGLVNQTEEVLPQTSISWPFGGPVSLAQPSPSLTARKVLLFWGIWSLMTSVGPS
ncbi:3'-5' exoribonuclease 1-like [Limulus polyphemus]|uniref:3'-5' exoribonuclease 1-like n=1 Tax=Limulus polyphemus TaxID=6850 RepID=A0ABM1SQY4_LIMPO|nr:3'-5' exoribonuclease 1-like [Limulus polyphemus]